MNRKNNRQSGTIFRIVVLALAACLAAHAENLAFGRACRLEPSPNYPHCASATDEKELTDGQFCPDAQASIWVQPQAVGWQAVPGTIRITVDLGGEAVFDHASFSTAAGVADVRLPTLIDIEVSGDGEHFHTLGCLTEQNTNPLPSTDGYQRVTYAADFTAVAARHVRFRILAAGAYFFGEELTVERLGTQLPVAVESLPAARSDEELQNGLGAYVLRNCLRRRLQKDLALVTEQLDAAPSQEFLASRQRLEQAIRTESLIQLDGLRTVVPMHPLQTAILQLHGLVLRELGHTAPVVWTQDRFKALSPYALPPSKSSIDRVATAMMNGERRGLALQFTNAADTPLSVTLATGDLQADVFQALFVDSNSLKTDAVALVPMQAAVAVPSGMTTQFYLRLAPQGLAPGRHVYPVTFAWDGGAQTVDVELTIAKTPFPAEPTLSTGWWDYLDFGKHETSWGLSRSHLPQALALEQSARVDTTFNIISPAWLTLTPEGTLAKPLDFTDFDAWVAQWPNARNYVIYLAITPETKIGDAKPGTARFRRAVADWARQWERHLLAKGLSPNRVVFHILDEPRDEATWQATKTWAEAIRAGSRRLTLYTNPLNYPNGAAEILKNYDVICPLSLLARKGGKTQQAIYSRHLAAGHRLWLYICHSGPFNASPWYYRREAWLAFKLGATGSFFWSLGDTGGVPDGWNQYAVKGTYFSPLIVSPDGLTLTKHWEAAAEAVADYEYLVILQRRMAAHPDADAKMLLNEAVERLAGDAWDSQNGCALAESYRLKILAAIERLQ